MVTLLAGYLLIVCDVGPRFMKNRKPYNVDRLMIAYNLFQVFMCGVVVVRVIFTDLNYNFPLKLHYYIKIQSFNTYLLFDVAVSSRGLESGFLL